MDHLLPALVTANLFTFLILFMRLGTALMVMPGIGDSFVTVQARLLFALGFCFVLTPFLSPSLPALPAQAVSIVGLLAVEFVIGLFIGTVMRIMLGALDTAGSLVSIQAGYSNALLFNPVTATQGTMVGALYSMLGITLLFVTDLHHNMLASVVESYRLFPAGRLPDLGSMSEAITRTVSLAFKTGAQIAIPFIIVGLVMQIGFGVLGRLMPQVQVFFVAMPLQIFLSLILIAMTLSVSMMFWLNGFDSLVTQSLSP